MQKTLEFLQGQQVIEVRSASDLELVHRLANLFDCSYRQTFLSLKFKRMKDLIELNTVRKGGGMCSDKSFGVEYHPCKGFTFDAISNYEKAVSEEYFIGIVSCRDIEKELDTLKALIN